MCRTWIVGLVVLALALSFAGASRARTLVPHALHAPARSAAHASLAARTRTPARSFVATPSWAPAPGGHAQAMSPSGQDPGPTGSITVGEIWVGNSLQVRAQRLDNTGAPMWGPQGALVCAGLSEPSSPVVVSDEHDGAIVAWQDDRGGSMVVDAQRIAANGTAVWSPAGVPVCAQPIWQGVPLAIAPDGSGGAIVGWVDARSGTNADLYAQRLDASGTALWTADGVALCTAAGNQTDLVMTPDDAGGAIFAWTDGRGADTDIYAQRLDASGAALWTADGEPVCASAGAQSSPSIAGSFWPGLAGAIVAWTDTGNGLDIRAQRVVLTGALDWPAAGVALCAATGDQRLTVAVSDANGGAIVTWQDGRGADEDLYAQRVDSTGAVLWTADGVPVCTAAGDQGNPSVWGDRAGGMIVAWEDWGSGGDVFAQWIDPTGAPVWAPDDGVLVCGATAPQSAPAVTIDRYGPVVYWLDDRSYFDQDVYAQELGATGAGDWTANGVPALLTPGLQMDRAVATAAGGLTLVAWNEKRDGYYGVRACLYDSTGAATGPSVALTPADGRSHLEPHVAADPAHDGGVIAWEDPDPVDLTTDVRAQRLDGLGVTQWPAGGVPVCTAAGSQWIQGIVPDATGGAIVAWLDTRASDFDLYAQRVDGTGAVRWTTDGVPVCTVTGGRQDAALVSDDQGGAIAVWDDSRGANLDLYGQRVDSTGAALWTAGGVAICTEPGDQRDVSATRDLAGGVVLAWSDYRPGTTTDIYAQRLDAGGTALWAADGVPLCGAAGDQGFSEAVNDSSGGAIVSWWDDRPSGGVRGIYAQRIDGTGAVRWTADGVRVATEASGQTSDWSMAPDAAGGALIAWDDWRTGPLQADVYAQDLDAGGAAVWYGAGLPVCTVLDDQLNPSVVNDGYGGAVVVWEDWRDGVQSVLQRQRIAPNGAVRWPADGETAVLVTLESAIAEAGGVRLAWRIDARTPRTVTVQRSPDGAAWTDLAHVASDAAGRVAYEDAGVRAGARVAYRIAISDGGVAAYSAPAWVTVPAGVAFALESPRPNPVAGELVVAYALPRAGPARFEVIDLTGRRVLDRTLAGADAGRGVVMLAPRGAFASGVYWLRLTSGGRSLARKICVVR